jgi:hypothetical protein
MLVAAVHGPREDLTIAHHPHHPLQVKLFLTVWLNNKVRKVELKTKTKIGNSLEWK